MLKRISALLLVSLSLLSSCTYDGKVYTSGGEPNNIVELQAKNLQECEIKCKNVRIDPKTERIKAVFDETRNVCECRSFPLN